MVRHVTGEGPRPCPLMVIGESPNYHDDRSGRPFCGPSGEELSRYLEGVGFTRDQVYLTHLVKYRVEGDEDPLPSDIARDERELITEVSWVQPQVIVTLGVHAARYFLGADVSLERNFGFPYPVEGSYFNLEYNPVVFPLHSPATILHMPELAGQGWYGWKRLGDYLRKPGKIRVPVDQHPDVRYSRIENDVDLIEAIGDSETVAIDTEGDRHHPWCLTFSFEPGTGYMIRSDQPDLLALFNTLIDGKLVVFHNALYDIPVLRTMGVTVTRFTDTMVMSYLLGVEPKGLKSLAYRRAGMGMMDYEDLTRYDDDLQAREYLQGLVDAAWIPCGECNATGYIPGKRKGTEKKCDRCKGERLAERWEPEAEIEFDLQGNVTRVGRPWCLRRRVESVLGRENGFRRAWYDIDAGLRGPAEAEHGHMPVFTLSDVQDQESVLRYACRDADATLRLYGELLPDIVSMGLEDILSLDISAIPLVDAMHDAGILLDQENLRTFDGFLEEDMLRIRQEMFGLLGKDINPSSSKQVGEFLYGDLRMPVVEETPGGLPSTDDKTIETLRVKFPHPALDLIGDYRERHKLKSTYTEPLQKHVEKDGRIRTKFSVTRVATGRLASSEPNLMNQPTRTDLGKRIRESFVASPGNLLGSWDLDQIEMRVLAHESEDPSLLKVFREGLDIHKMTASLVFGVPIDQVTDAQRSSAKSIGFGILYGITADGLMAQLYLRGIEATKKQCQEMIDAYLTTAYPGVGQYMSRKCSEAKRYGYVRDMFGRIRYLPGVRSSLSWVRSESERQAGNFPIQSAAQGLIKLAMAGVHSRVLPSLHDSGIPVLPLLQIHDELIMEFPEDSAEIVNVLMLGEMTQAMHLNVPIRAKGHWGKKWSDLK